MQHLDDITIIISCGEDGLIQECMRWWGGALWADRAPSARSNQRQSLPFERHEGVLWAAMRSNHSMHRAHMYNKLRNEDYSAACLPGWDAQRGLLQSCILKEHVIHLHTVHIRIHINTYTLQCNNLLWITLANQTAPAAPIAYSGGKILNLLTVIWLYKCYHDMNSWIRVIAILALRNQQLQEYQHVKDWVNIANSTLVQHAQVCHHLIWATLTEYWTIIVTLIQQIPIHRKDIMAPQVRCI